jgi:hypothetical protein
VPLQSAKAAWPLPMSKSGWLRLPEERSPILRNGAQVLNPPQRLATSYRMLKLFPFWDPLRGDPRFGQIVASLAPKDAASPTK